MHPSCVPNKKEIPLSKYSLGQPLWSDFYQIICRPIAKYWDNNRRGWIYCWTTRNGKQGSSTERDLSIMHWLKRDIRNQLMILDGGYRTTKKVKRVRAL